MLMPAFATTPAFSIAAKMEDVSERLRLISLTGFYIPVLSTQEKVLLCIGLFGIYSIFRSILAAINFVFFLPSMLIKWALKLVLFVLRLPLRILSLIMQTPYFAFTIIHAIGVLGFGGTLWYITTGFVGAGAGVAYFCPLERKRLWFESLCEE